MAWTYDSTQVTPPVVKFEGKCRNPAKHKFCAYWMAKLNRYNKEIRIGYKCSLFDQDKEGYDSLPECNTEYGQTYDGPPHI